MVATQPNLDYYERYAAGECVATVDRPLDQNEAARRDEMASIQCDEWSRNRTESDDAK